MTLRRAGGCLALIAALVCAVAAQGGVQADKQYQAALHKEMVDGDLRAAIEEYRVISARPGVARELAATALVRMAECFDKLGDPQARAMYERVVRYYGDQPIAADVRQRLASTGSAAEAAIVDGTSADDRASRTVWSSPNVDIFGGGIVSRDGRLLTFTDWTTGDLVLHDLASGGDRRLTDTASFADMSSQRYAGDSRISPDGRYVAYSWLNGERYDLRVLDLRSEGAPQPRVVYDNADVSYVQPFDWSPDGTRLAVQLRRTDGTGQIALVTVSSGALTPLKSFPWRDGSTNMFFSPDGRLLGYDLPSEDAPGERDVSVLAVDGSRDVLVTPHRRNDEMVGWSPDGTRLLFASDRTGSIQLWTQSVVGLESQGAARLVPSEFRGQPKGVTTAGDLYYLATTYEASPFRTTGFNFEDGGATGAPADPGEEFYSINEVAYADWSPDGQSLALNRRDRAGNVGMLVSVLNLDGRPVRHVRPQLNRGGFFRWRRDGTSFITAGADLRNRSGLFSVDAETGAATALVLSAEGESHVMPELSPAGAVLYYRHVTPSAVRIVARTLATGVERELIRRSRRGPSESANVLAGLQLSPDGEWIVTTVVDPVTSLRALVGVAVSSGQSRELMAGTTGPLEVLMWAPDSRSVFVRRRGPGGTPDVLRIPTADGEPMKVEWTLGDGTRDFRVHPDGGRMVFVQNGAARHSEVRVLPGLAR
jgi:Tol biopolymer transport system component